MNNLQKRNLNRIHLALMLFRSYQTTLLLGKPNAVCVKGMRSFVFFNILKYDFYHDKVYTEPIKQASMVQWLFRVPYKPEIAGLIRVFLSLSDKTIN